MIAALFLGLFLALAMTGIGIAMVVDAVRDSRRVADLYSRHRASGPSTTDHTETHLQSRCRGNTPRSDVTVGTVDATRSRTSGPPAPVDPTRTTQLTVAIGERPPERVRVTNIRRAYEALRG